MNQNFGDTLRLLHLKLGKGSVAENDHDNHAQK